MSLHLYDEALLRKFTRWTKDTAVTLTGVNESTRLFTAMIDKSKDKNLTLPLISLSRPGGFTIVDKGKQPRSYSSAVQVLNRHRGGIVNTIGISIPYQIDVYTRYQSEADEYIRNIVFNIINYPNIDIEIPYEDLGLIQDSSIRITTDVEDNSDIPERLISDQFTRYTLGINIDDAYLFDVRIKDNISIVDTNLIID